MMNMILVLVAALAGNIVMDDRQPIEFEMRFPSAISEGFSGSVYLMFTRSERRAPSRGPDWFQTEPFYRIDVADWKPDTPLIMDRETPGFPESLGQLEDGRWRVQAVMRSDPDSASIAGGNAFTSEVLEIQKNGNTSWPIEIVIDQETTPRALRQIPNSKLLEFRSDLLSRFHERDVHMKAVAFFPPGFNDDPDRRWPVLYVIGGFPGGLDQAAMSAMMWGSYAGNDEFVIVYLDAESMTGHHVFADSSNNGPHGKALVSEFIPWLESNYPLRSDSGGRLLTGHSSGGWSSLWLQVNYPQTFGGTWSTAPDPVDFRAFQEVDVYAVDGNAYVKPDGSPTRISREGRGQPSLSLRDFCRMEEALGDGGQIRSFEWVFSPTDGKGRPKPLFDRVSGEIDPEVAQAWKKYDISLILLERWEELAPSLAGKIHVYMGNDDTFYLDKAARLMKTRCQENDIDVEVVMLPGDHSSILFGTLSRQILKDMKATARMKD